MKDEEESKCKHCGDPVAERTRREHWYEGDGFGYGHHGYCCDCMDLSCGIPMDILNQERLEEGKPPLTKPWPGLDKDGKRVA